MKSLFQLTERLCWVFAVHVSQLQLMTLDFPPEKKKQKQKLRQQRHKAGDLLSQLTQNTRN